MRLQDYINNILDTLEDDLNIQIKYEDIIKTELPDFLKRYTTSRDVVDLQSTIREDAKSNIRGYIKISTPVYIPMQSLLSLLLEIDTSPLTAGYRPPYLLVFGDINNHLNCDIILEFNNDNIKVDMDIYNDEPFKFEHIKDKRDFLLQHENKHMYIEYIVNNIRNQSGEKFQQLVDTYNFTEYDNDNFYNEIEDIILNPESRGSLMKNIYIHDLKYFGQDFSLRKTYKINI